MPAERSPQVELADIPIADLRHDLAGDLGGPGDQVLDVAGLHAEALAAAVELDAPEVLGEQLRWEATRLRALGTGIGPQELGDAVRDNVRRRVGRQTFEAVEDLYRRAAEVRPALPRDLQALPPAARLYLSAALSGRRSVAVEVVTEALRDGVSAHEVTLGILGPAQIELGRLWEAGEVSVSQEHFTTAVTQTCLSTLAARPAHVASTGRRMVAAAVGGEGHDVGLRMLSELMAHQGWETSHVGANVPVDDLVGFVANTHPDVLALSATMPGHLLMVREVIDLLREDERCADVRVLVGGRAFALKPEVASDIGADGWAKGPAEAIELTRSWFGEADATTTDSPAETDIAGPTGDFDPTSAAFAQLVTRYGQDPRHTAAALEAMAAQAGISVTELMHRLTRPSPPPDQDPTPTD